ncbi:hypothetical protein L1987_56570 [Smallanthus sonchifolius]|uniref:Uncharacterized protein n=1 Tax=Smallanthus sonchifolius TaxID=185202 RepID=A0ACB9EE72_9ASTR|nr:hypothetical protein L1987_56570 [Smallanthus sonchifolius]
MEEINGSLSKSNNRLKEHTTGHVLKSTNKVIINYRRSGCREDEESFGEFSWPPKSYTCSFCKREFRSAQALGGHMNVHRREKAKLRQITPQRYLSFLHPQSQVHDQNPNPNPNPNPNITTCSFTSNTPSSFPPFTHSCCPPFSDPYRFHLLRRSNSAKAEVSRSRKPDLVVDFSHEKEGMIVKKLDNGLLVEQKFDDLDLELRLGCS